MSKYLEMKEQIEQLTAQLEDVRREELASEIIDMKKRIIGFGIRAEDLFSAEELRPEKPTRVRGVRSQQTLGTPTKARPAKYAHNGHQWTGQGAMPNWYKAALASGVNEVQMAAQANKMGSNAGANGA